MNATKNLQKKLVLALGILATLPVVANADTYASLQRKDAALGHYGRARSMLVEALAEFEQARKFARPDMLIDPEEWRLSVISRTEELNRILDPKPRVTRGGVVFRANKLLIRREKQRPAVVEDGAKDNNVAAGEKELKKYAKEGVKTKIENARASLAAEQEKAVEEVINTSADSKARNETLNVEAEKLLPAATQELPRTSNEKVEPVVTTITEEKKVEIKKESSPTEEVKSAEDRNITKKNIITDEESVSSSTSRKEEVKPATEESTQSKLVVEDDEEVVGRTRQEVGTDSREDEITRKIEKALEERMKQEQHGSAAETEMQKKEGK